MKLATYRVKPKSKVDLGDWDPDDTRIVGEKMVKPGSGWQR
jgi:hypothetical protein